MDLSYSTYSVFKALLQKVFNAICRVCGYYKKRKATFIIISLFLSFCFLIRFFNVDPVLFLNRTESSPRGIYIITSGNIKKGDFVTINTNDITDPNVLSLPDLLIKKIIGLEGDLITYNDEKLLIGGYSLQSAGSYPPFTSENLIIPEGKAFLVGEHRKSYDSRYFGLVPFDKIKRVKLLWKF